MWSSCRLTQGEAVWTESAFKVWSSTVYHTFISNAARVLTSLAPLTTCDSWDVALVMILVKKNKLPFRLKQCVVNVGAASGGEDVTADVGLNVMVKANVSNPASYNNNNANWISNGLELETWRCFTGHRQRLSCDTVIVLKCRDSPPEQPRILLDACWCTVCVQWILEE